MGSHVATAVLVIANGETKSATLADSFSDAVGSRAGKVALDHARFIDILSPVGGTVEVAQVKDAVDANFVPLRDGAANVTVEANVSKRIPVPAAHDLRVVAALAVGAATNVRVSLQEEI